MNIAICDDKQIDCEIVHSHLDKYLKENNISATFYTYSSGEEFLENHKIHYDIVFMDIYMKSLNGIDAAIQYNDKTCKFVFTSTSPDFSLEAFSVNVAHYLIKPITYEGIAEAMQRCFPQQTMGFIYLKSNKHTIPVLQQDIIYIEVFNNTVVIHTVSESISVRMSLKAIYDMLNPNIFVQPQRSFIVNMNHIDDFTTDTIRMTNGSEILMSREQKPKTMAAYETFLFSKVRKGNSMQ